MKICETLEIEKGLQSTVKYLQNFMPIDRAFLQYYESDLSSIRTIASASATDGKQLNIVTKMPKEAVPVIEAVGSQDSTQLTVINRPEELYPAAKAMLAVHGYGETPASLIHMPLLKKRQMAKQQSLGALVIVTEGIGQYSDVHAKLLSAIMEPLAVSMSNALVHRKVRQLKELLADDNRYLHRELHRLSGDEIIGVDFGLKNEETGNPLRPPPIIPFLVAGQFHSDESARGAD